MSYPSDIRRKKFEIIREELETFSKRTSPRKYDLYVYEQYPEWKETLEPV